MPINPIKKHPHEIFRSHGDYTQVELEGVALGFAAFKAKRRKNPHEGETSRGRNEVELEGVEPSSEQGNHTLSTRLS